MRPLRIIVTVIFLSQFLIGCSDNESESMPVASGSGADLSANDPLDESVNESVSEPLDEPLVDPDDLLDTTSADCAGPPDFQTGDAFTYRFTDESGFEMDISISIANSDETAIVFDVTEGASVYQAALSKFCDDTPESTSDPISVSLQPLIDQFQSRPLLIEIGQPGVQRFDDGTDVEPEGERVENCADVNVAFPPTDGPQAPAFTCTLTLNPDVAGSTVVIDTTITYCCDNPGMLVEKRQTAPNGSTRSLVLVSLALAN